MPLLLFPRVGDSGAGGAGVTGSDTLGPPAPSFPLPRVVWTVNDDPVSMYAWSASNAWDGGYDQMRGTMTLDDRDRVQPAQGFIVRGFTADGAQVWEGRITSPPQEANGAVHLSAQGYRVEAQKMVERIFIQSRSMDIWTTTDSEPHLDGSGAASYDNNPKIDCSLQGGITWGLDKDVTVTSDKRNGAICYLQGVNVKRLAYVGNWDSGDDDTDLALRVYRANGPNGAQTFLNGVANTSGNRGDEQDYTIASPEDAVILYLHTGASVTPADKRRYHAQRIRVNSDICLADSFTSAEIAEYIGDTLGWSTGDVSTSSDNALPFDWDDGSWADALTYLSEGEDRYWRVTTNRDGDGPRLEFDDWGTREWTVYLSRGARADLIAEEVFNECWVWYESPNGIRRRSRITAADIGEDDPLSDAGITNVYEYELNDRQADGDRADAVGERILRRVIRQRFSGTIDASMVFDEAGASRPFDVLGGDTVRIADWGPGESLTLRIMEAELSDGGVQMGVEKPVNLASLLGGGGGGRKHKGKRRGVIGSGGAAQVPG